MEGWEKWPLAGGAFLPFFFRSNSKTIGAISWTQGGQRPCVVIESFVGLGDFGAIDASSWGKSSARAKSAMFSATLFILRFGSMYQRRWDSSSTRWCSRDSSHPCVSDIIILEGGRCVSTAGSIYYISTRWIRYGVGGVVGCAVMCCCVLLCEVCVGFITLECFKMPCGTVCFVCVNIFVVVWIIYKVYNYYVFAQYKKIK